MLSSPHVYPLISPSDILLAHIVSDTGKKYCIVLVHESCTSATMQCINTKLDKIRVRRQELMYFERKKSFMVPLYDKNVTEVSGSCSTSFNRIAHIAGCILLTHCQFKYITIRVMVYTYMHKTIPMQPNTDHIKNAIPL